jgi:DNA polymerase III subunit gamma/tau
MAQGEAALFSNDDFVSLYRRYRPGTFAELRGQDHVVRALQSAVRDGHVAHAYLFSGPRGTGKTSTARILAKALNCMDLIDGEPCGVCASCIEITKGTSMDVTELDAASNNGVDAIRDLIAHAALGSPGRSKVYIIDEVHMLSASAANALLKTLEEPPPHVVFVLATTDPQKVPPTIRSRTQHLEFRLLGAETLGHLLRDVRDDAGLGLDDEAIGVAVRRGRGSARDALSALDQVVASGEATDTRPGLDEVVEGFCEQDAARALVGLSSLHEAGWSPQQLCTELVEELRQAFLLGVAPQVAQVTGSERDRLGDQGARLGLARTVRALELLGRCLVEMRDAPDPQVVLEVAVVRGARSDLDEGTAGVNDRILRLERKVTELTKALESAPSARPAPAEPVVEVPEGAKPSLGAYKKGATPKPKAPAPEVVPETTSVEGAPVEPATVVTRDVQDITKDDVDQVWSTDFMKAISPKARSFFRGVRVVGVEQGSIVVEAPNDVHLEKCQEFQGEVVAALGKVLGAPLGLDLRAAVLAATPKSRAERIKDVEENLEIVDPDELSDAPEDALSSVAEARIKDAFPGAIEEEG